MTQAVGLSLALGAFLAGLLISESDYAHEAMARLLALRDASWRCSSSRSARSSIRGRSWTTFRSWATMVVLIVVGKLVVWTVVVRLFGHPLWTALLVAVGFTQIGEFSFILIQVARAAGHVGADVYNTALAAALITILLNAALVRVVPRWIGRARLHAQVAPVEGTRRPPRSSCAAPGAWAARSGRLWRPSASPSGTCGA